MALKGVPKTDEWKEKVSGKNNYQWKGDRVSYFGLHIWVNKRLGRPKICSNLDCHYPRKNSRGGILKKATHFHWANKSHEYRRDITDWIRLCTKCHSDYDRGLLVLK